MVLVRKPETELLQGVFTTFPELSEWPTKDLYSKHPSRPDHWLYEGRADDIISFSNGEKLHPLTIEQSIEAHPEIRNAIVIGASRLQPGLLLDPADQGLDVQGQKRLLDQVWPLVKQANSETVTHGRISKRLICFTRSGKPLLRTRKGTVRRKLSVELYAEEINLLYETINSEADLPFES